MDQIAMIGGLEMTARIDRKKLEAALRNSNAWLQTDDVALIATAAAAHLATLPKTKMVKLWAVDYVIRKSCGWQPRRVFFPDRDEAEQWMSIESFSCMRLSEVEHEIPDDD